MFIDTKVVSNFIVWPDTLIDPPDIHYVNYVNMEHIGVKNEDTSRGFSAIKLFPLFHGIRIETQCGADQFYQQQC